MALTYEELIGIQNKRKKQTQQEQKVTVTTGKQSGGRLVKPVDDIAPVKKFTPTVTTSTKEKEDDRTWFKKSSYFDDGYQRGDIAKAILGTVADAGENISAGIVGMGEKAVDALTVFGTAMSKANLNQANFNMMSSPLAVTKKGTTLQRVMSFRASFSSLLKQNTQQVTTVLRMPRCFM